MTRSRSGCVSPVWARSGRSRCPSRVRDDVLVRTVRSGVSRGTETLVFRGGVPASQYAAMRAPFQEGDFPGPVKYGYLNVGVVEHGPPELQGRTVFCLYPHQTAYVVPARAVTVVPDGGAAGAGRARRHGGDRRQRPVGRRAAARRPGHGRRRRHGRLLRRAPARRDSRCPRHPGRRRRRPGPRSPPRSASTSRCPPTPPAAATSSCTPARRPPGSSSRWTCSRRRARSSTSAGTATPRSACRSVGPSTPGGSASGPARSAWSRRPAAAAAPPSDRLALALDLLRDPAFDALITGESRFEELPEVMARLADGSLPALCHTITYGEG